MAKPGTIDAFHAAQTPGDRAICDRLRDEIDRGLPGAEAKMWHAHPVWFLEGNPVVGYSKLKTCVRLFFWSGQSFHAAGLKASGNFKAAEKRYTDVGQIDGAEVQAWLTDAAAIQWDYANIYKTKGKLTPLKGL